MERPIKIGQIVSVAKSHDYRLNESAGGQKYTNGNTSQIDHGSWFGGGSSSSSSGSWFGSSKDKKNAVVRMKDDIAHRPIATE